MAASPRIRPIVPPYLLEALARHPDEHVSRCARHSLDHDHELRGRRRPATGHTESPPDHPVEHEVGAPAPGPDDGTHPRRTIADAHGQQTTPGTPGRTEGQPSTGDAAADEAYDGLGATWELYRQVYGRDSLDDHGLPLLGTVHYGKDYDNAFWDGTQMVFGDGDGTVFNRFTIAVDVVGHELTHGVTQFTAGLDYQGQSGALNESLSDVFGSLVKQRGLGQDAAQADWLIGAGLFTPAVHGVALRSMKAPGTAYDDPQLGGKDPQPATMSGYVHTTDDNGGVHLNSGIPNHAFYLAATAIGGNAWEGAGLVWFDVLTSGSLAKDADFTAFAQATVAAAERRYAAGSRQVRAVEDAWVQVGVLGAAAGSEAAGSGSPGSVAAGSANATELRLRRTGGLAGRAVERTVALDDLAPDLADGWRSLLAGDRLSELAAVEPLRPVPDAFTYHVAWPPRGAEVELSEHAIPEPVRDLFVRTLQG
jgi:hypothetical protein